MLIIGELINASRKQVGELIQTRNRAAIQEIATAQVQHGADYIDINAGTFLNEEPECLKWLVETVQAVVDAPCCIDSPNPDAVEAALSVHKGPAMINSISLEKMRYSPLLSLVAGTAHQVVALCMSDEGIPHTPAQRLSIADTLINGLIQHHVPMDHIYVDALVQPVSTDPLAATAFLTAVDQIMNGFKGVHTVCGLSNISYGLPVRRLINRIFLIMAIARGLDAAIINPLDKRMMSAVTTSEMLAGQDDFCMKYLSAFRENNIEE